MTPEQEAHEDKLIAVLDDVQRAMMTMGVMGRTVALSALRRHFPATPAPAGWEGGEPVAWMYEIPDANVRQVYPTRRIWNDGWTETPLGALAQWASIESAPKDGTEFLSYGGPDNLKGKVQPTRWLSPGPYSTENGKNTQGERRYQWPDGFYWAGYDGFVGPVFPELWQPMPTAPAEGGV